MTTDLVRIARRFALTVAAAGIASVAVAPAAFASPASMPDTSNHIISPASGDLVKVPFFCDADNMHKQHNVCLEPDSLRF